MGFSAHTSSKFDGREEVESGQEEGAEVTSGVGVCGREASDEDGTTEGAEDAGGRSAPWQAAKSRQSPQAAKKVRISLFFINASYKSPCSTSRAVFKMPI